MRLLYASNKDKTKEELGEEDAHGRIDMGTDPVLQDLMQLPGKLAKVPADDLVDNGGQEEHQDSTVEGWSVRVGQLDRMEDHQEHIHAHPMAGLLHLRSIRVVGALLLHFLSLITTTHALL